MFKILIILTQIYLTICCRTSVKEPVAITNWNDLKVTWGSVTDPSKFVSMPRTVQEAEAKGWVKEKDCSQVNGNRYILNGDKSVLLIYNTRGIIAGISSVIPKGLEFNFPSNNVKKLLYDEGDVYTINAYFMDPNSVCASPRSLVNLTTGDRLIFKGNGLEKRIELEESKLSSFWTQGKCFKTMGVHYWANLNNVPVTEDISADDLFPAFLLYNNGKLNGFGWAFNADLNSIRYEHPLANVIGLFFKTGAPKFFSDPTKSRVISTIHIFLDSTPQSNNC